MYILLEEILLYWKPEEGCLELLLNVAVILLN